MSEREREIRLMQGMKQKHRHPMTQTQNTLYRDTRRQIERLTARTDGQKGNMLGKRMLHVGRGSCQFIHTRKKERHNRGEPLRQLRATIWEGNTSRLVLQSETNANRIIEAREREERVKRIKGMFQHVGPSIYWSY